MKNPAINQRSKAFQAAGQADLAGAVDTAASPLKRPAAFHPANAIARAIGICKKSVHRQAKREGWPWQRLGNRFQYSPPPHILAALLAGKYRELQPAKPAPLPTPRFLIEQHRGAALRAIFRFYAWAELDRLCESRVGHEEALARVAETFPFPASVSALRRWQAQFEHEGLAGLLERKEGRVGRKKKTAAA